jgi:hypothetical protein
LLIDGVLKSNGTARTSSLGTLHGPVTLLGAYRTAVLAFPAHLEGANDLATTVTVSGFVFGFFLLLEIPPPDITDYWIDKTYKQKLKARTIGFLNAVENRHRFTVEASPFHRKTVTVSPWKAQNTSHLASPFHRSVKRKTQDLAGMAVGEG